MNLRTKLLTLSTATTAGSRIRLQIDAHAVQSVLHSFPNCKAEDVEITAFYQYVDFPKRASFKCNDEKLNKIWEVAEHTFRLCSGIFFLDGVKRDKWIWSGDAYQSFFVNQYLLADPDIDQRTLLALRGNDPMTRHINTIMTILF